MIQVFTLLVINLGLMLLIALSIKRGKINSLPWSGATAHIAALIMGWGAFAVMLGLMIFLDGLESRHPSFEALVAGLIVAMRTLMIGLIVFAVLLNLYLNRRARS